jgi:hypothetical protein
MVGSRQACAGDRQKRELESRREHSMIRILIFETKECVFCLAAAQHFCF